MPLTDSLAVPYLPPAGLALPYVLASADGAITVKGGVVFITKGSAAALTLAAPTAGDPGAGGDDGKELIIVSTTAFAHTVTVATAGFNDLGAAGDVCTFTAAKGNGIRLIAYGGDWWVVGNINGTLA
jgi:hypothetical protein